MTKATKIREGKDVTRLLLKEDCTIRMGKGSHRVAKLQNGETFTYYDHGEFPPGTRMAIVRVLKKAGFFVAILCAAYQFFT